MILLTFLMIGCEKKGSSGGNADSTQTLPAQPPLEPLDDGFQEPDSVAPAAAQPANPRYGLTSNGPYTLQIALFQEKRPADRLAASLNEAGIPAYVSAILDPTPGLSGTYYRVRAGAFATTKTAREYGRINLTPLGKDFWVDLKARDSEPVHPVYTPRPAPAAPAPVYTPPPAPAPPEATPVTPPPAAVSPQAEPAPAAAPQKPLDPALVPKDLEGKPAVKDTPTVQDW